MSRAPQSLVAAVKSAKRENQLTGLLSLVLEAHLPFANKLFERAKLPPAAEVRGRVEVMTRSGRFVDLELLGFDEHGSGVARLWSENKTGAGYQPKQLPDYAMDIPELPKARQLITIVDDHSEIPDDEDSPEEPRWMGLTWQDIAVMAWEAGREETDHAQRDIWREAAGVPQAPASQRILLELLNYLEEEHGVVLDPLGHEHVAAFAYMPQTSELLEELLAGVGRSAQVELDGKPTWGDDLIWQAFSPAGTWAEPLGGWADVLAAPSDDWTESRIGEPAFGTGYVFPRELADVLLSLDTLAWRQALAVEGFSVRVGESGTNVSVRRTKYLAELIPMGVTLDLQCQALGKWVNESLAVLARHDPAVEPPAPRPRRGRAPVAPDESAQG
jgi:hypothetical protein